MSRLILCGAVAGALMAILFAVPRDDGEDDPGIVLAEAGESNPDAPQVRAERVESLEDNERGLAQLWLIAFGAGAFFLLELVSPLGIFYSRTPEPVPEDTRRSRIPERHRGFRVPAA